MKKLLVVLVLGSMWAGNVSAQATVDTKEGWSVSAGVGTSNFYDLMMRYLSAQDLYKLKPRLGLAASLSYRAKRHWGMSFIWNQCTSISTNNNVERILRYHTLSLVYERRFAIKTKSYWYWGIGFGAGFYNLKKVPALSSEKPTKTTGIIITPQWKPIGICFGGKRVRAYLEAGVGTIPWGSGGLRVWLSR